jgi:hypothetical protein
MPAMNENLPPLSAPLTPASLPPQPLTKPGKKWLPWVIGGGALVLVVGLGVLYSSSLGTRIYNAGGPPISVAQGSEVSFEVARGAALSNLVAHLCRSTSEGGGRCETVAVSLAGDVVTIRIPEKYPTGDAVVRVLARNTATQSMSIIVEQKLIITAAGGPNPYDTGVPNPCDTPTPYDTPAPYDDLVSADSARVAGETTTPYDKTTDGGGQVSPYDTVAPTPCPSPSIEPY